MAYTSSQIVQAVPTGINSALVFITGTSFSAVTSVSLPNSTFTSTYRNYKIFYDISTMSADATLTLRLRASGTDNSTNNYFWTQTGIDVGSASENAVGNGVSSFTAASLDSTFAFYQASLDLFAPQLAQYTSYLHQIVYVDTGGTTASVSGGGIQSQGLSFDSLTLIASAGNMTGNYKVYGYANS
jgi:hypothetical protein